MTLSSVLFQRRTIVHRFYTVILRAENYAKAVDISAFINAVVDPFETMNKTTR
jgi:hypothetical protein